MCFMCLFSVGCCCGCECKCVEDSLFVVCGLNVCVVCVRMCLCAVVVGALLLGRVALGDCLWVRVRGCGLWRIPLCCLRVRCVGDALWLTWVRVGSVRDVLTVYLGCASGCLCMFVMRRGGACEVWGCCVCFWRVWDACCFWMCWGCVRRLVAANWHRIFCCLRVFHMRTGLKMFYNRHFF